MHQISRYHLPKDAEFHRSSGYKETQKLPAEHEAELRKRFDYFRQEAMPKDLIQLWDFLNLCESSNLLRQLDKIERQLAFVSSRPKQKNGLDWQCLRSAIRRIAAKLGVTEQQVAMSFDPLPERPQRSNGQDLSAPERRRAQPLRQREEMKLTKKYTISDEPQAVRQRAPLLKPRRFIPLERALPQPPLNEEYDLDSVPQQPVRLEIDERPPVVVESYQLKLLPTPQQQPSRSNKRLPRIQNKSKAKPKTTTGARKPAPVVRTHSYDLCFLDDYISAYNELPAADNHNLLERTNIQPYKRFRQAIKNSPIGTHFKQEKHNKTETSGYDTSRLQKLIDQLDQDKDDDVDDTTITTEESSVPYFGTEATDFSLDKSLFYFTTDNNLLTSDMMTETDEYD